MTLTDMLDLLQPILDRWQLVLLALVLVTLLGNPARNLIGAQAVVLRVPAAGVANETSVMISSGRSTVSRVTAASAGSV